MAEREMTGIEALREMVTSTLKYDNNLINKVANLSNIVLKDLENFEKCKLENCDYQIQISELQDKYSELQDKYDDLYEDFKMLNDSCRKLDKDNKKYERIEEELGCSLIVREKALDSFYCPKLENDKKLLNYYVFAFDNEKLFIRLIYSQYDDYYNEETSVALKDYGKTWALRKSDLENE